MRKSPYQSWIDASMDWWTLGVEASTVIGLRTARLAQGGAAAQQEAQRMVSEKIGAAVELQMAMMTGALGGSPASTSRKVARHYSRKVRANRRRLG